MCELGMMVASYHDQLFHAQLLLQTNAPSSSNDGIHRSWPSQSNDTLSIYSSFRFNTTSGSL